MVCCFRKNGSKKISTALAAVINKLTAIRLENYNRHKIQQEINEEDYKEISELILLMGENILKANIILTDGVPAYKSVYKQFSQIVNSLAECR